MTASSVLSSTLALVLLAAPFIARAAEPGLRLEPATADDLAPTAVVASRVASTAPHGPPVSFAWPTDQASDDLAARPAPHSASATGHARTVEAAQLHRGVTLAISSPGAFIKLSPAARDIRVTTPDGHTLRPGAGLEPVGRDGLAFTLDRASGAGEFTLQAAADTAVRVDVLERDSELVLLVQAARDVVFVGDQLRVEARLLHRGQPVPAGQLSARLVAPDGRSVTRRFTRHSDGTHVANLPVQGEPDARPWSVEVELSATVAGRPVRRTVTTAVAVSVPTARLTGAAALTRPGEGLRAELELEVASDSRYAVSAVLHGHNREGQLQPIAIGQSAAALAPGRRQLALEFDAKLIAESGLRAPFELHDLRLVDQGRMFVLHRQARALAPGR